MNLAGIDPGESAGGHPIACVGSASTIANVAHRVDVRTGRRIEESLAVFARERTGTALGYVRVGASVEIHAKTGNGALARGAHNDGASRRGDAAVRGAVWIDPERIVFFNDPSVVGEICR